VSALPRIELQGVSKRFDRIIALDNVSTHIDDGEYLCVLGPTGSGKTTLLRSIAGLVSPDEGSILIDGARVNDLPPERRNATMMPQNYALFPHMTAWENVAYGLRSKGASSEVIAKRTMDLFQRVRLQDWTGAYPNQLSGGMQQRVALIRCLASGARTLLLDEPLGALDARLRLDLRRHLKRFAKRFGLTVIHVTHDQSEAISLGDRILLLRHGRVEQAGTPRQMYFKPRTVFAASFVGDRMLFEGVVTEVRPEYVLVEIPRAGNIVATAQGMDKGELVVVTVRCESLRISTNSAHEINRLKGTVREVRPLGPYFRCAVEVPRGPTIYSHVPSGELLRNPVNVGSEVEVEFSPKEALAYKYPEKGLALEVEAL